MNTPANTPEGASNPELIAQAQAASAETDANWFDLTRQDEVTSPWDGIELTEDDLTRIAARNERANAEVAAGAAALVAPETGWNKVRSIVGRAVGAIVMSPIDRVTAVIDRRSDKIARQYMDRYLSPVDKSQD
ncbi:MAG TPA: hypothetical protein VGO07_05760 [Candidatus Saccharimonadales bacterium]|jgi:hypothetical protein|nr:hypothetical protein [Candidatus Saccharimonadales bacterium]